MLSLIGSSTPEFGFSPTSTQNSNIEQLVASDITERSSEILSRAMVGLNAAGAGLVIMNANTGQIRTVLSHSNSNHDLPEFPGGYHRAIDRVHELGLVFSVFTVAQAIDIGLAFDGVGVSLPARFQFGEFFIRDWHSGARQLTPGEIVFYGSSVGATHLGMHIGAEQQNAYFEGLGLLLPSQVERDFSKFERVNQPLSPSDEELRVALNAVGHGFPASLLSVAAAYASLVNGGAVVEPNFTGRSSFRRQVISTETSLILRRYLEWYVSEGAGTLASVGGVSVGGIGSTTDLRALDGQYQTDSTVSTFVGIFPIEDPQFIVAVLLEDGQHQTDDVVYRTSGWTAAPIVGELIEELGPTLLRK
jgi:cell division protein FtsI (penicillin-binding protein 3)